MAIKSAILVAAVHFWLPLYNTMGNDDVSRVVGLVYQVDMTLIKYNVFKTVFVLNSFKI